MTEDQQQDELRHMSEEDIRKNDEDLAMKLAWYRAEMQAESTREVLADEFNDYIYENYAVGNGDMLINIIEDGNALANFLEMKGLPPDTEIDI